MLNFLNIPLFAILNRARGSQLGSLVSSTTIGRIVSMISMALMISKSPLECLLYFLSLYIWCVFSWDVYWGMAGGTQTVATPCFRIVDYILKVLKISNSRLYGIVGMGLRQGLCAIPLFIALAYFNSVYYLYFALIPFLFGLIYFIFSKVSFNFVLYSELTIGAILGTLL